MSSLFDKWEKDKFQVEFLNNSEEEKLLKENKIIYYMPCGFTDKGFDTSNFPSICAYISLPSNIKNITNQYYIIADYCRKIVDGKETIIGKVDKESMDKLSKILNHHKNFLEESYKQLRNLRAKKYEMAFYFDNIHYVIPLIYYGKEEKIKQTMKYVVNGAKIIAKDIEEWMFNIEIKYDYQNKKELEEKFNAFFDGKGKNPFEEPLF